MQIVWKRDELGFPSFWQLQVAGCAGLYLLDLLSLFPSSNFGIRPSFAPQPSLQARCCGLCAALFHAGHFLGVSLEIRVFGWAVTYAVPSAVDKILELSPDVVFLDVPMPGMDGFEVLRVLPSENLPSVIFLTAYEQHALRAFEVHALDYLLKPVDDGLQPSSVKERDRCKKPASGFRWPTGSCACWKQIRQNTYRVFPQGSAHAFRLF
jgi:CheY-like chemotaxis protein